MLIAFGANLPLGDQGPAATIIAASKAFGDHGLSVKRLSRLYRTPCFPRGAGPDYINAAARVTLRYAMTAQDVLAVLHGIEATLGRSRQGRWAGRTLDLDLLAMGDSVVPDAPTQTHWRQLPFRDQVRLAPDQPILPHPRLQDRSFVLVPLADVAADWVHPLLGLSVTAMLAGRPADEVATVVALPDMV